jgi:hypothetical protein
VIFKSFALFNNKTEKGIPRMRKRLFEDFLLNKLNGYYLILYGHDYRLLARLVFKFGQMAVYFLTHTRLISPRIYPSFTLNTTQMSLPIPQPIDLERIRERAYFLWAEKGYPDNTDVDNWLEAEKLLCY